MAETKQGGTGGQVPAEDTGTGAPSKAADEGHPHQENRSHHKHNNAGQDGHKAQKHSPAEEKH